ncbi:MAG: PDZ domain-containing protein [Gemmataceae bacterium]|nr:PDZ domain-containing protein [Gemmataceae bacterium]
MICSSVTLTITFFIGELLAQSPLQNAIQVAVKRVAPSVVTIETSGGSEVISLGRGPRDQDKLLRKGVGATTGVIVHPDGWILSSAFNFANKPTSIIVSINQTKHIARIVATDTTRSIALLKIPIATPQVAEVAPISQLQTGQTVIALGRTLSGAEAPPSVSVGIISALNRIQGKAIQTDAKISPINYGGPLVDLSGRVAGILVPLSPQGEGDGAGIEWYDSGIGFSVPLEHCLKNLPKLMEGKDLKRGMLGILLKGDPLMDPPEVGTAQTGLPAQKAGMQTGDRIVSVGGIAVDNQTQFQREMSKYYAGDKVSLVYKRGDKVVPVDGLELISPSNSKEQAQLGIYPIRDDEGKGILIRHVNPKGPADLAGLASGDRILAARPFVVLPAGSPAIPALKPPPKFGRADLVQSMERILPGMEMELLVQKNGQMSSKTFKVKSGLALEGLADLNPATATNRPLQGDRPGDKKPQTGLISGTNNAQDRSWKAFLPKGAGREVHGIVVWFHPPGRGRDNDLEEIVNLWENELNRHRLVLLMPQSHVETGWNVSDASFINETVKAIQELANIDPNRIVAHGFAQGGQMAGYLGLTQKGLYKGVAAVGAIPSNLPRESPDNGPKFFLSTGDRDPQMEAIKTSQKTLRGLGIPCFLHIIPQSGQQYLDLGGIETLNRWIEGLDGL